MKKYILMGHLLGIGGWQLYCDARVVYLRELGYEVYFTNYSKIIRDRIKIDTFQNIKTIELDELYYSPFIFSNKQINGVIDRIKEIIGYSTNDEVFVESTTIQQALWGEQIAKATNGIHFAYLLHSHFENIHMSVKKFFVFKYNQGLLGGMTNKTVPDLIGDLIAVPENKANGMCAISRGPLSDDCKYDEYLMRLKAELGDNTIIIGYFGTLSKPHFSLLCDELLLFFKAYRDLKFCFLSVGSSSDGTAEVKQNSVFAHCDNVITRNIPELFPVPRSIFRFMDLCIGSWGSSRIAAKGGAITLRLLDDKSINVQGIIGITLLNEPYYEETSPAIPLYNWLEDFLIRRAYDNYEYYPPSSNEPDFRTINKDNDSIIMPFEKHDRSQNYYNTNIVQNTSRKWRVIKLINSLFGFKTAAKFINIYNSRS